MLLRRPQQHATWPFLCLLAVLFALSVTAPRAWQRGGAPSGISLAIRPSRADRPAQDVATPTVVRQVSVATGEPTLAPPPDVKPAADGPSLAAPAPLRNDDPAGPVAGDVFPSLAPPAAEPVAIDANRPQVVKAPSSAPPMASPPRTAARPARINEAPEVRFPDALEPPVNMVSQTDAWPAPTALLLRLEPLTCECECCTWALSVDRLVRRLIEKDASSAVERLALLDELEELNQEAAPLSAKVAAIRLGTRWRQAQYALTRRLGVWRAMARMDAADDSTPRPTPQRELALAVADVDDLLGADQADAAGWRDYICLDALRDLAEQRRHDEQDSRALAQKVLARLSHANLTGRQRELLGDGPLARLEAQLQPLAAAPVDLSGLLADIEAFEVRALPGDAERIARAARNLAWSADTEHESLGRWLDRHYRNANFRVAVSGDLLSRMLPVVQPAEAPVNETILGVPVNGQSSTTTQLSIRTVPAAGRLLLELAADGDIASRTRSDSGLAILHNRGQATYAARKLLDVDLNGVRASPATADVNSQSRLRDVRTDFDMLPFVGYLFQEFVRSEYSEKSGRARREQERKIDARVRTETDRLADERLQAANRQYRQRVLGPLDRLSLSPQMIEATTTDERVIARVRLASDDQLGSHTPRPVAPSDSLLSVQVHQSAMNNLLAGLELEGGTFSPVELGRRVEERLNRREPPPEESPADDVSIRFAQRDALRARFVEDRIELTVAVAELNAGSRAWRDFEVRVFYRPSSTTLDSQLTRDGSVQLIGQGVGGPQIALRGIFTRMFSSQQTWPLLPPSVSGNARLAECEVTQCVIDDGWLGLAVGPRKQVARRTGAAIKSHR